MIALAGMWEFGWSTPIHEADQWEYLCREFAADVLYMTPVSGIRPEWPNTREAPDIPAVLSLLDPLSAVFLDEHGEIPLQEFEHPESCVYVCGRASCSPLQYMRPGDQSVRIVTPTGLGVLWAHQAATIALYDRQVKGWQQP